MALNPQQMAALQTMLARQQQQEAKPDIEFRAGICHVKGRSVSADSRRGKLELYKEESGEIRLQWVLRPSNQSEINLVLLPHQAVFHRINDCKDGRIFALQFLDSSNRHLFWLQEPKESEEKDNELLKKLNDTIQAGVYHPPRSTASAPATATTTPSAAASASAGAVGVDPALLAELGMSDAEEQAELLAMIQAAAQANANNNTPSTPAPKSSTPAATATNAPPRPNAPAAAPSTASGGANAQSALLSAIQSIAQQFQASQHAHSDEVEKQPTLSDIFDADQIYSIVSEDENLLNELCALLPEGQRTKEDLKSQLRSPQLRSTLSRMTGLLNSAQYGQLLASLSLPTTTQNMGVLGLIEAIHKAVNQKKGNSSSSSAPNNEKK